MSAFIAYNVYCVNSIVAVTEIVLLSSVLQQQVMDGPILIQYIMLTEITAIH